RLPDNASPEDTARYVQAQKELSGFLGRLMMVAEATPQLKADKGFLQLQADLKQIETQLAAARNRYIREVAAYNVNIRSFPGNIMASLLGYSVKPQLKFEDEQEIHKAPVVKF